MVLNVVCNVLAAAVCIERLDWNLNERNVAWVAIYVVLAAANIACAGLLCARMD